MHKSHWFVVKTVDGYFARPTPKSILTLSLDRNKAGVFASAQAALEKIKAYCEATGSPPSRFKILTYVSSPICSIPVISVRNGIDVEEEAAEESDTRELKSNTNNAIRQIRQLMNLKVVGIEEEIDSTLDEVRRALTEEVILPNIHEDAGDIAKLVDSALKEWCGPHCVNSSIFLHRDYSVSARISYLHSIMSNAVPQLATSGATTAALPVLVDARPGSPYILSDDPPQYMRWFDRMVGYGYTSLARIPVWLLCNMMYDDYPFKPFYHNPTNRVWIVDCEHESVNEALTPLHNTYVAFPITGLVSGLDFVLNSPTAQICHDSFFEGPNSPYLVEDVGGNTRVYRRNPDASYARQMTLQTASAV